MNEQLVKQLVMQNERIANLYTIGPVQRAEVEQFVEAIVRECVSVVENLSPGYDDYRNQIEDAFRRDCVEQMKQHFGVEE